MGKYAPSKEEMNNPELYKKNYAKRAKRRVICTVIVYAAAVLGMLALVILKHFGGG